jgi:hypothetical protein
LLTRLSAPPRLALAAGAAVALLLGLTGCMKKLAGVDASYVSPEGVPTTRATLVLTPDVQLPLVLYEGTGKPLADDSLLVFPPPPTLSSNHALSPSPLLGGAAFGYLFHFGAGILTGQIFDQTPVSTYQVLRRESGGGYRIAADFELPPVRRWLDTEWEGYAFVDGPPASSYRPLTYLGRGTYSHQVTSESPLTNAAILDPDPIQILHFDYRGMLDRKSLDKATSDSVYTPPDSLFEVRWTPATGAVGYWIQLYQFTGGSFEQVQSSWPSAAYLGASRDYLLAYLPAPADHFRVGDPGATIITRRAIILHQDYNLKIAAVNARGQVIGMLQGRPMIVPLGTAADGIALWGAFFRGAILIRPGPEVPSGPQAVTGRADMRSGPATALPRTAAPSRMWSLRPTRYTMGALRARP